MRPGPIAEIICKPDGYEFTLQREREVDGEGRGGRHGGGGGMGGGRQPCAVRRALTRARVCACAHVAVRGPDGAAEAAVRARDWLTEHPVALTPPGAPRPFKQTRPGLFTRYLCEWII